MIDRLEEIKGKLFDPEWMKLPSQVHEDMGWLLGYAEYLEKQMSQAIQGQIFECDEKAGQLAVESEDQDQLARWIGILGGGVNVEGKVLIMPILKREEGNPSCPTSK